MADNQAATEDRDRKLEELLEAEVGGRHPGGLTGRIMMAVALSWSLFQLWYSSPLPFILGFGIFNSTEARSIHLAFGIFLAFLAFPALKRSPRDRVPAMDWVLAAVAAFCAAYIYLFYQDLAARRGLPTTLDIGVAVVGIALLLEATRRTLGPPLMIVALVFMIYTFGGPYMPDVIAHGGASIARAASHYWITTEGVFGVALGVSTSFVFLFVLFSALLDRAGAGNYFIKLAFALLGHMKGGPAKASVVSSGLNGVVSGSSIANVVTGGVFTISLMKRVGYTPDKAAAIEASSSVNGQIMPPVMGAAAFLMVEYVGIPYIEVIKHAALPAVISYIALYYIVHLEALKLGLQPLPRRGIAKTLLQKITGLAIGFGVTAALCALVYYGIGWLKVVFGDSTDWVMSLLLLAVYIALIAYASRYPDLEEDDPSQPVDKLPSVGPTFKVGLHFLLPVVVLVWCLVVERLSAGLSAFYATALMIFIVVTQRPLFAYFRKQKSAIGADTVRGLFDLRDGMVDGARNMIAIAVATAAAGIVVGTVTLTGIGFVMTAFVAFISGGHLALMLIFTALFSLVLGMGLPTTANYIVVSSLMAPVLVDLAAQNGLIVPLIAVHMFVFYFGIMADVTPPVGLASYAAAAIAGSDPLKTGAVASFYSLRTAVLPFLFIFNTELLLIGIDSWLDLLLQIFVATVAMLIFAAATMNYYLTRSRIWETVALLLIAFTLFRPGYWWDMMYPPYRQLEPTRIVQAAEAVPAGGNLAVRVQGLTIEGSEVNKVVLLPMGPKASGQERLQNAGLSIQQAGGEVTVGLVAFGSTAQKVGINYGYRIAGVQVPNERPPEELMYIPAFLLLGVVTWLQARRRRAQDGPVAVAA